MPQVESLSDPRSYLPNTYSSVTAREIDFVTRFGQNWDALREILGVMRPIRKAPGTRLVSYTASVTLQSGSVDPGEVIPYSAHTIAKATASDLSVEKYAHAVTIEEVATYGAEIAVEKSDDAFLVELQNHVLGNFYTFLNTGTLTGYANTWQSALAKAKGAVLNKFNTMRKSVTNVVGVANVLDLYDYLGDQQITVQSTFGLNYVKDFMGYSTLFLLSAPDIIRGRVIALPVENIDLYYIDPSDSDFAKLGLDYTVQGDTNLIGFHAQGNYSTAVGETYALMGMALWAEYLDGIAVYTVSGVLPELEVTSVAGSSSGKTKITYSGYNKGASDVLKYKIADDPVLVHKGDSVSAWTTWDGSADITAASNKIINLAVADSSNKVLAEGYTTVTSAT